MPCLEHRRRRGFSLLELLVVLLIAGLLYAIAAPQYRQFVLRANRSEAQAMLVDAAARQARYHAQHQRFITTQPAIADLQLPHTQGSEVQSANGLYRLTVGDGDGGYLLMAEPLGAQRADSRCASLMLDGTGTTGITGNGSPNECWK
ncbi:type IV pilus assembly protein PilE [Pseudomonas sp. TE3786]